VPVRSVLADLHRPALYAHNPKLAVCNFAQSVEGGERIARYSFLGADPDMIVRGRGLQTVVERDGKTNFPASGY
jgi:anthranilate synthase component 1